MSRVWTIVGCNWFPGERTDQGWFQGCVLYGHTGLPSLKDLKLSLMLCHQCLEILTNFILEVVLCTWSPVGRWDVSGTDTRKKKNTASDFNKTLKFIYLWVFIAAWALLYFQSGGYSSCGVRASHCSGFSCCRAWAPGHRGFSSCDFWAQ